MDTLNSCHMCVKVSFDLHSQNMIGNISEMPNTFDVVSGKYEWKQFGLMSYAIVPQSFRSNTARVDILVCMDEDDLDDIDLKSYVGSYFATEILPRWQGYSITESHDPIDSVPGDIGCLRAHYHGLEKH